MSNMDIQSKDILKQVLERLDKMDSHQQKLDRVIERLGTLQNILERQNQKQNLLDQMLVQMTVKLQNGTVVTKEQLQGAQQDISEPLHVIDNQRELPLFPRKTTQTLQSLGAQIGDKLQSMEDRTVDTAQKCNQLTSWSLKKENKMTELAGNSTEMMKTFLIEMRSVKDLIKGQTNSELIWLNNQIDKKLPDIGSVVRDIYQQQTEAKEETARSTGQDVKSMVMFDKQMQAILDLDRKIEQFNSSVLDVSREVKRSLDTILTTNKQSIIEFEKTFRNLIFGMNDISKEQSLLIIETLKSDLNKLFEVAQSELQTNDETAITESDTQTNRIKGAAETAKDLRHPIQIKGDNISKFVAQLGNTYRLINFLLESIERNMTTVVTNIDSTEAAIINTHTTVNNNLEELISDLKDYIYKTKREIFAVTEKEAQIVRNRIQGPLQSPGKYTFDLYVNNFKSSVRSGKEVHSLPWHINELQTCVTGYVTMSTNGEMEVWLLYGRHPREVGLQPRSGKELKVKATICDICENILPSLDVGEVCFDLDETEVEWNGDDGCEVGVISCDMLLERGYGDQEDMRKTLC